MSLPISTFQDSQLCLVVSLQPWFGTTKVAPPTLRAQGANNPCKLLGNLGDSWRFCVWQMDFLKLFPFQLTRWGCAPHFVEETGGGMIFWDYCFDFFWGEGVGELFGNITTLLYGAKEKKHRGRITSNEQTWLTSWVGGIAWIKPRQQNHAKPSPVQNILRKSLKSKNASQFRSLKAFITENDAGNFVGINVASLLVSLIHPGGLYIYIYIYQKNTSPTTMFSKMNIKTTLLEGLYHSKS